MIFSKVLQSIYSKALVFTAAIVFSVLTLISFVSTTLMANGDEFVFIVKDSVIKNIIVVALVIIVFAVLHNRGLLVKFNNKLQDDTYFTRIEKICLLIVLAIGVFWVLNVQSMPQNDQSEIMKCAYEIKQGNFTSLEAGGYIDAHRNQIGLTCILMAMSYVIGDCNYIVVDLINAVGLMLAYKYILVSMRKLGTSRIAQLFVMVAAIVFWPFIMFTTFTYGIIWHTTLAIIAFYNVLRFLDEYKARHLVWAGVLTGLAIVVKSNALIFYIALVIYLLVNMDYSKFCKSVVLAIAVMVVLPFIINKIPTVFLENTAPLIKDEGIPKNAYIKMGISFSDGAMPGWYDKYVDTIYQESGYSKDVASERVNEEIKARIAELKGNSKYTYTFFLQKIASMWNEPSYESFMIAQGSDHSIDMPGYIDAFLRPSGYNKFIEIEKLMQLLTYLGAFLWVLLEKKERVVANSFFVMCFVGGFIFHFVWEAKSQYAIPYVVMLLPCAVLGWEMLLKKVVKKEFKVLKKVNLLAASISVVTIVLAVASYLYVANPTLTSTRDNYNAYLEKWSQRTHTRTFLDVNQYIYNSEMYWLFKEENEYLKGILDDEGIEY